MAQEKNPKGGKDNFTRNLVIAVVLGVVLIMLVPTLLSKQTNSDAAIPSNVSVEDGYGVVFNKELQDVPFIEIYEDFMKIYHKFIKNYEDFMRIYQKYPLLLKFY